MIIKIVNCKFSVKQAEEIYNADHKDNLFVTYNYAIGCLTNVGYSYDEAHELCDNAIKETYFEDSLNNLIKLIKHSKRKYNKYKTKK